MIESNGSAPMGPIEAEVFLKGYLQGYYAAVSAAAAGYRQLEESVKGPYQQITVTDEEDEEDAAPDIPEDEEGAADRPMTDDEKARINAYLAQQVDPQ